ncbi:terpene synthase family protein [Streptomyces sp. NPDC016172]|uniref:terpene synthase family protein n=1 Tax=Streptomyces sp. NPDC016172 TaxID=3364964 RepID=UPI0036FC1AB8
MKHPSPAVRPPGEPSRLSCAPAGTAERQAGLSDGAAAAQQRALDWLHRYELATDGRVLEQVESIWVGAAFSMLFPRAKPEIQGLASDVFTWITAFGDVLVDGRDARDGAFTALMLQLSELLHGSGDTEAGSRTGFAAALGNLLHRCDELLPCEHGYRVRQSLNSFVMAQNWHVNALADAHRPDLEEYVVARRHLVGGWALIALLGPLESFRIPARLYRDPRADQLNKAACNLLAWLNDLSSYERESRTGDAELTLPSILMRERHFTLTESLTEVASMCDAQQEAARRLTDRCRRDADQELADYGELVCGLMQQIAHWHLVIAADRYR